MTLTSILLILATSISIPAHNVQMEANGSKPLGWDLSYTSLLEKNKVSRDEFLWKWLAKSPRSPVEDILLKWKDEPIISSILMEKAGVQGQERVTLWLVRTQGKVYLKGFVNGKPSKPLGYEIRLRLYDDTFKKIIALPQSEPLRRKRTTRGGTSGYAGFLSLYDRGESGQILLTLEDFYSAGELKAEKFRDELGEGRLRKIFEPLLSPQTEDDENGLFCPAEEEGATKIQTSPDGAASINSADKRGCTALMRASENGHLERVRELLKMGADVNKGWTTPLMLAARRGHLEIVKLLLAAGADPNARTMSFHWGDGQALMFAMNPDIKNRFEIIDAMIAGGAELNPMQPFGRSPLFYAIEKRDKEMIKGLLARGAKINFPNSDGDTALMVAVLALVSDPSMIKFLLAAGADVNARNLKGETALAIVRRLKKDFPNSEQNEIIGLLTNVVHRPHKRRTRIR